MGLTTLFRWRFRICSLGAGEKSSRVKRLLPRCEDQSSDSWNPHQAGYGSEHLGSQVPDGKDSRIPEVHMHSLANRRPWPKQSGRQRLMQEATSMLCMCACACTHTFFRLLYCWETLRSLLLVLVYWDYLTGSWVTPLEATAPERTNTRSACHFL